MSEVSVIKDAERAFPAGCSLGAGDAAGPLAFIPRAAPSGSQAPAMSRASRESPPCHRRVISNSTVCGVCSPGAPRGGLRGSDILGLHLERPLPSVRERVQKRTSWESREMLSAQDGQWGP